MKRGRYYLGRVIKLGTLDQEKLMNAISEAAAITVGQSQLDNHAGQLPMSLISEMATSLSFLASSQSFQ